MALPQSLKLTAVLALSFSCFAPAFADSTKSIVCISKDQKMLICMNMSSDLCKEFQGYFGTTAKEIEGGICVRAFNLNAATSTGTSTGTGTSAAASDSSNPVT